MHRIRLVLVMLLATQLAMGCGGSSAARDNSGVGTSDDDTSTDDAAHVGEPDDAPYSDPQVGGDDPTDGVSSGVPTGHDDPTDGMGKPASDKPTQRDRRFEPSESRDKISAFLLKPAKKAMSDNDYQLAVSYYRALVRARGEGDEVALDLARAWRLGGQYNEAIEVYEAFAEVTSDTNEAAKARAEARRLRDTPLPFTRQFEIRAARREAVSAYNDGRKAFKRKRYPDALLYYQIANELDPDLPGPVREMGAVYDKLGVTDRTRAFYLEYLRRRPFGKLSDEVRKRLAKLDKNALGTLRVESKLPCEILMVEKQPYTGKLPIKKIAMAPGNYTWLCVNYQYNLAYYEYVDVTAGKNAELEFNWAVIVNKTENPIARIAIEDSRQAGVMKSFAPFPGAEIGVLVPADGRALKLRLEAADRSGRVEERFIRLKPGQKEAISWSKR